MITIGKKKECKKSLKIPKR